MIKAHLKHLNDHGQKDYLNQAINILKDNNMEIPDYKEEKTFSCGRSGSMEMELGGNIKNKEIIISTNLIQRIVQPEISKN